MSLENNLQLLHEYKCQQKYEDAWNLLDTITHNDPRIIYERILVGFYYKKDFSINIANEYTTYNKLDPNYNNWIFENMHFYSQILNFTTHLTISQLDMDNKYPINGSFFNFNGKSFINVRLCNWSFWPNLKLIKLDQHPQLTSHNMLIELNKTVIDDNFKIINKFEWNGLDNFKKYHTNIQHTGIDDIRFFVWNNTVWGVGTTQEYHPESGNRICLLKFNIYTYHIENIIPLFSDNHTQKNWLPFICNNRLTFIYKTGPELILLEYNQNIKCIRKIFYFTDLKHEMNGSCPPIKYKQGYLYMVHQKHVGKHKLRLYHRFVYLNNNLELVKISNSFIFSSDEFYYPMTMWLHKNNLFLSCGIFDSKTSIISINTSIIDHLIH